MDDLSKIVLRGKLAMDSKHIIEMNIGVHLYLNIRSYEFVVARTPHQNTDSNLR